MRCFYQKIRLGLSQLLSLLLSFLLSLGISRYLFREKYQLWLEYHDAGCQVRFVKKITASGEWEVVAQANLLGDSIDEIQRFIDQLESSHKIKINKKYRIKTPVYISLDKNQLSASAAITLPENYSEQDIENFIIQEQASLFPQSQGELLFDFLINNYEKNHQEIEIFSLEKKTHEDLISFLRKNNFHLVFLGFDKVNFIPWREMRRERKKRELAFSVSGGMLMAVLTLFFWYVFLSQKDISLNNALSNSQKNIARQKEFLNNSIDLKQDYKNKVDNYQSRYQSKGELNFVLYLLAKIDIVRPVGLQLDNIIFFDNKIIISGEAKNLLTVQKYEKSLNSISLPDQLNALDKLDQLSRVFPKAKIQLLKNIKHSQLSQYFEIGVTW